MTSRPRTSIGVVIPVHGGFERMIETALDAVAMQSAEAAAVVVVVDGPHAEVERVLRDHPMKFDHLVLPANSGGPATPRNAGLNHLRSRHDVDAIWFLDSDDVPHPRFLEIVSRTMKSNPEAALVCTRFQNWQSDDEMCMPEDPETDDLDLKRVDLDWYLDQTGSILPSFTVLRTRALSSLRESGEAFETSYRINQDYDLFARLLHRAEGVQVDWKGGLYRLHDGGISARGSSVWLCRTAVDRDLTRFFLDRGDEMNAGRMRQAEGSSLRKAARHLWRRDGEGDRSTAMRLLADDLQANGSIRSLLLLLALPAGLDLKARLIPRKADTRLPPEETSAS